jgi:hypothetical protein
VSTLAARLSRATNLGARNPGRGPALHRWDLEFARDYSSSDDWAPFDPAAKVCRPRTACRGPAGRKSARARHLTGRVRNGSEPRPLARSQVGLDPRWAPLALPGGEKGEQTSLWADF